jgi:hypothetical protein
VRPKAVGEKRGYEAIGFAYFGGSSRACFTWSRYRSRTWLAPLSTKERTTGWSSRGRGVSGAMAWRTVIRVAPLSLFLACLLIAASALPAKGGLVQLESGGLFLDFPFGGLQAEAPGLSIFAGAGEIDASNYPLTHCAACRPGDVVGFNGSWLGTSGSVTWQGIFYETGGALDPVNVFGVSTPTIVVPPLGTHSR